MSAATPVSLFHYPLSRSVRVRWLLEELDLPVEIRHVKLLAGEALSEDYLKINPNHAVPVLQYRDNTDNNLYYMYESSAICMFVARNCQGGEKLIPNITHKPHLRAQFEQLYAFLTVTMDSALWQIRTINDFRQSQEKDLLQFWCARFNGEVMPQIETALAHGGQTCFPEIGFSLCDIILTFNLSWASKYMKNGLLNRAGKEVTAYMKRHAARPAYQRATADRALFEKDGDVSTLGGKL
jgi:glutathione S-transferase